MNSIPPETQAEILIQALPYIQTHSGKTIVIKYGGAAMTDDIIRRMVMRDLILMRYVGVHPVLVHGGGPEVSSMMQRMGKEPRWVGGLRVTDDETMEIVEMVLAGKTNKAIVSQLNSEGAQAVGLSGKDANLFVAARDTDNGDIGSVGKIAHVNPQILTTLESGGFLPVICSVAIGSEGESYNVNADTAASALAVALNAKKLILMTDVEGLYADFADKSSLISEIYAADARKMLAESSVAEGMIPKLLACIEAVEDGVESATILDGRRPHALLMELFTNSGSGTMVC